MISVKCLLVFTLDGCNLHPRGHPDVYMFFSPVYMGCIWRLGVVHSVLKAIAAKKTT